MDPLTIAYLVLSTIGTAVGAGTTLYNAKQQASASLTSAAISKQNTALQEYNARVAQQRMANEQRDSKRKFASLMGNQQAQAGVMGVDLTGSISDILDDAFSESLEERRRIKLAGEQETFSFKVAASEANTQSKLFKQQAKSIRTSGMLTATGQLFGGAASATMGAYTMEKGK